eukprot:scaffold23223_cov33-Tisochrysis_lutea.AAC.8
MLGHAASLPVPANCHLGLFNVHAHGKIASVASSSTMWEDCTDFSTTSSKASTGTYLPRASRIDTYTICVMSDATCTDCQGVAHLRANSACVGARKERLCCRGKLESHRSSGRTIVPPRVQLAQRHATHDMVLRVQNFDRRGKL